MAEVVIAYRTHLWDDSIEPLARRLKDAAPGCEFCVIADETNGELDVPPDLPKLSHTADFAEMGLLKYPQAHSLWYNADYPLYFLRKAYPSARFFVMSEFDVMVNSDLSEMIKEVGVNKIDFMASNIKVSDQDWVWNITLNELFDPVYSAFIPFLVISAEAIDFIYRIKQELTSSRKDVNSDRDWPYCEGFIPSAIINAEKFRYERLEKFFELPYFTHWPPISISSKFMNNSASLMHPVLPNRIFLEKLLNQNEVNRALSEGGCLRNSNLEMERGIIANSLFWKFRALGRKTDVEALMDWAQEHQIQLPEYGSNIAYNKPAMQSSVCEFSQFSDISVDAKLGNSSRASGLGFHTGFEKDPWWQCDLEEMRKIGRIVVFNRMDQAARCTKFVILSSNDCTEWTLRFAKIDDLQFGGSDGCPIFIKFDRVLSARYIKFQMIGEGILYLDQVEIFENASGLAL